MTDTIKEDFLTPEERASLGPKEPDLSQIEKNEVAYSGIRPTIITVLCGYFFVSWILNIINIVGILSTVKSKLTLNLTGFSMNTSLAIIISLLYVTSVFGYWLMKKWGVFLYTAVVILSIIISATTIKTLNFFFFSALFLPIIMILFGFKYLSQME